MTDVNKNSITFSNHLLSINKVRESDSRIFLNEFGLVLIEPLGMGLWCIDDLIVGHFAILKKVPDPFSKSSDVPIGKSDWLLHKIC